MLFRVDKEVSKYRPTDSRYIGLEYDTKLNMIQQKERYNLFSLMTQKRRAVAYFY